MIQALTYANTNLIADTSVAMEPELWSKSPALDPVYTYFVITLSFAEFPKYPFLYFYATIRAVTYANTNLIAHTSVAMEPEIWSKSPALDPVCTYFVITLSFSGFPKYPPFIFMQLVKKVSDFMKQTVS